MEAVELLVDADEAEVLFSSSLGSSKSAISSSMLMVPSSLVSSAAKTSLVVLSLSDDADVDSLGGGGGGIPPGGGGGIPPSFSDPSGGFMFLSAATSSSVLILPLLSVSRMEKISLADELLEDAAENSLELTEPSLSVSNAVSISDAISSKLGFELCVVEEIEEVYDAYEL